MKTFKLKYILGVLFTAFIAVYSSIHDEKYSIAIPCIFCILFIISLSLLVSDRSNNVKYIVVDSKDNKEIKSFVVEEEAIEFADNQNKDTKHLAILLKHGFINF